MSIHARIKQAREAKDLSMEKLAEMVGVKAWQTVQQWEKEGGTAPKRERLKAVADALGVNQEWLLFGMDSPNLPPPGSYAVPPSKFREVPVIGKTMGGISERIWDDAGYPAGQSDKYAEIATQDPNAFLTPVDGNSMVPRYNPGEYALVEPNTEPEIEDDVLVRFKNDGTSLKRLLSRRGGFIRLGSYNTQEVITCEAGEVQWMYYVAHPVPARKIKTRT